MLRNADMVGCGEVEYVRMGDGEYRNFMVENSERDYYAQTRKQRIYRINEFLFKN